MTRTCTAVSLLLALAAAGALYGDSLQLDASRLEKSPVPYVQHSSLKELPVPVICWRRAGLARGEHDISDIKEKILYPAVFESANAIAAFVVEFQAGDLQAIGVVIVWANGATREALIQRNEKGDFAPDAYRELLAKPTP